MYAITGASGQLGRLVVKALLNKIDAGSIVALVRDPSKVDDLMTLGVEVRAFDYNEPETLALGLNGVGRMPLISSSEVGKRELQHRAVIEAAKLAGVGFIAYTSIIHADTNPQNLAIEHRATEKALKASGLSYALLRNSWYTENYTMFAPQALTHGVFLGSAGHGRISGASRADYAAAAAAVLASGSTDTQVYELAGDDSFTLTEVATAFAEVRGKPVVYMDLPQAQYQQALARWSWSWPANRIGRR